MKIVKSLFTVVLILSSFGVSANDYAVSVLLGGGTDNRNTVDSGPIISDLEFGNSKNFSVSFLYKVQPELSLGLEYAVNQHDLDSFVPFPASGDIDIHTLSINVQYMTQYQQFKPYIGAGMGSSHIDSDAEAGMIAIEDDGNFFMFNVFAGAQYPINKNFAIQAQVRFQHAVDAEIEMSPGLNADFDYDNLSIMVGAQFSF